MRTASTSRYAASRAASLAKVVWSPRLAARLAPMLLQPVVENAITHGLEPKVEGGEIAIGARLLDGGVCVEISDTGGGLAGAGAVPKSGGGVGLSNLRERLASLYGGAARVELLENQPCGMTVRLMLPLNASPISIPSTP